MNSEKTIQNIQGSKLNIKPIYAFITYIFIPIGLLVFVYPKIDNKNWLQTSLIYGFLFGFISYGIFDFTNLALIDKYPLDSDKRTRASEAKYSVEELALDGWVRGGKATREFEEKTFSKKSKPTVFGF